MNKTLKIRPDSIRAAFTAESYNEADNTIEIVFATETEVVRRSWDGKWIEVLACDDKSVRLDRLNSGANLVDNHSTWSVDSILGVVVRAWVEKKQCKAIVRLSEREEVKGIIGDIKAGIIRQVSVGYMIYEVTETDTPEGEAPKYRVTDWEPMELSLVCVPADPNSGVRSQNNDQKFYEVEIISQRSMETKEEKTTTESQEQQRSNPTNPASVVDVEAERKAGAAAERTRCSEIRSSAKKANIQDEEFIEDLISRGVDIDAARKAIIDKMAEDSKETNVRNQQSTVVSNDEGVQERAAIEEVLLHRANSSNELKTDKAKSLRHASLCDLAAKSLDLAGRSVSLGSISKHELIHRAMSTSDYPILLGNTVNRELRRYYDSAPSNWRQIARKRDASDFKAMHSMQFGGNFELEEIKEGGEYKNSVFKESEDSFALKTWGKKISITRQALINDDLSGFMRYTEMFGRGAAATQAKLVWALFTANNGAGRTLADGVTLFHADHKNLAASGGAMSLDTLNAARVAMTRQKGIDNDVILVTPKFLVVPPELELKAKQLINGTIVATKTTDTNPLQGAFEIISEVYLTNATAWYVVADPGSMPVIEYAFLNGQEGLYTEQQVNFDTDNLDIKVRTDFNASIFEHRGVYKNAGQ